jgi:GT2 family glycosyltransferase
MTDLAIVIVNFRTEGLTSKCLESVFDKKWKHAIEVWVVDNNSGDGSGKELKRKFPKINLIESDKNLGFAGGNNLALKKVNSLYSLLLNSDTVVKDGSLDNLLDFAKNQNFDIASCKLEYPDRTFQPNAGELPTFGPLFWWLSGLDDIFRKLFLISSYQAGDKRYYKDSREVGWVSGSVMLVDNKVFEKIGFLDDKIFMYGEDVEFCFRAKRSGFRIGWTDSAEIIHLGGGSSPTPKFNQWVGEFKGLLYLYQKYYGGPAVAGLKFLIYFFVVLRAISFSLLGKISYSKTYAKVLISI